MKIFNIDQYNEKLKINPVSQNEFDKLKLSNYVFNIDMVENYDIVYMRKKKFYMAFRDMQNIDLFDNRHMKEMQRLYLKYKIPMFIRMVDDEKAIYVSMEKYKNTDGTYYDDYKDFDIIYFWKAPKNIKFNSNYNFDSNSIASIMAKFNYQLIYMNEDENPEFFNLF